MIPLQINNFTLDWGARTYVMGILNVTSESFSGDGLIMKGDPVQAALDQAHKFLDAGADILDIGGESTRPGSEPLSAQAELERILPVITALSRDFPDAILSVDTYKAAVAEQAIEAGVHLVNDVWALRADAEMAGVLAKHNAPVILMHNRSNPASVEVRKQLGNAYIAAEYNNLMEDVMRDLLDSIQLAKQAGVSDEHIILDPGIGFGKTVTQNLDLINQLHEIRSLGYPVLLGPSRKSFIGFTLDLPPDQRVEGTAAAVCVGITRGADLIRVHDLPQMARVAKMTDALVRKRG
jgi:dihydropteroate synthase